MKRYILSIVLICVPMLIWAQDINATIESIKELLIGEWICISDVRYDITDGTYYNSLDIYTPNSNIAPIENFVFLDDGFGYSKIMVRKTTSFEDPLIWSVDEIKASFHNLIVLNTSSKHNTIKDGIIIFLSEDIFVLSKLRKNETCIYARAQQ